MKNILQSTTGFILWLNSLTADQVNEAFPYTFQKTTPLSFATGNALIAIINNNAILWRFAENHAKFMRKKIELGMFVPCDLNGNPVFEVMEDPTKTEALALQHRTWSEAKKRILFEGFTLKNNNSELWHNDKLAWYGQMDRMFPDNPIEDLLSYGKDTKIELTKTAQLEIYNS